MKTIGFVAILRAMFPTILMELILFSPGCKALCLLNSIKTNPNGLRITKDTGARRYR